MRPDEADVDDAERVVDGDDQPVLVALDIENDPVVGYDAGTSVNILDIFRRLPLCLSSILTPGYERHFHVSMTLPKGAQRASCDDTHENIIPCLQGETGGLRQEQDRIPA